MKKIFVLLFSLATLLLQGQENRLRNIIEVLPDGYFKMYFRNDHFELTSDECSELYVKFKILPTAFAMTDSLTIFRKNGVPYMKGKLANGKREGKFIWYYPSGKLYCEGYYSRNNRIAQWKHYYEDGKVKKIITYRNEVPLLSEFYNQYGVALVTDGNGHFYDTVRLAFSPVWHKVQGNVVNGRPDGTWKIALGSKSMYDETFSEGNFVHGVSHSTTGEEIYVNAILSNFTDVLNEERISFAKPKVCKPIARKINREKNDFETILKNHFEKSGIEKTDASFFAAIQFNKRDNVESVEIVTNNESLNKAKIAEYIKECHNKSNKSNEMRDDKMVIALVIKNGLLETPQSRPELFIN
ncbi:toxin-antitoxin system YwqK family antitoxin [Flavobacterium sp.]